MSFGIKGDISTVRGPRLAGTISDRSRTELNLLNARQFAGDGSRASRGSARQRGPRLLLLMLQLLLLFGL